MCAGRVPYIVRGLEQRSARSPSLIFPEREERRHVMETLYVVHIGDDVVGENEEVRIVAELYEGEAPYPSGRRTRKALP
jgi:hypothetical protein